MWLVCMLYLCYLLYIVFKLGNVYVIGVIELEFDDMLLVSVCFMLELFFVVYVVYFVFGEVCVLELNMQCCLMLFDYCLVICWDGVGMLLVNGLYWYGYMIVFVVI